MDVMKVIERVDGLLHATPQMGRKLYEWVIEHEPRDILELGFYHGVSTCYLAAALDELGRGHITTIDHRISRDRDPSIYDLLNDLKLGSYVTPVFAERTFTWEMYKLLKQRPRPMFDFAYHDLDHGWDATGYGFFLIDKVLRPGGWILFDDVRFTIAGSKWGMQQKRGKFPEEERETAAVGEVLELLVAEHPDYGRVEISDDDGPYGWGWTQKKRRGWPLAARLLGLSATQLEPSGQPRRSRVG